MKFGGSWRAAVQNGDEPEWMQMTAAPPETGSGSRCTRRARPYTPPPHAPRLHKFLTTANAACAQLLLRQIWFQTLHSARLLVRWPR